MRYGIFGGLMLAGLLGGAWFGIVYGAVLWGMAAVYAWAVLGYESHEARKAEAWRKSYPSYKY